jgi:D-arabinose 1-dehydrogenase-like Zn-dependent alcohol dehydrogenase
MKSIKQGGTMLVCGGHAGVIVSLNLGDVFSKQITIIGSARAPEPAVREAIDLAASGKVTIPIDRVYPFREIHAALRRLDMGQHIGKIVVTMNSEDPIGVA